MPDVETLRLTQSTPLHRVLFTTPLMELATLIMAESVSLGKLKIELVRITFAYFVSLDSTDCSDVPPWTIKREPHAELVP